MVGNLAPLAASVVIAAALATATAADRVAGPVVAEVVRVIDGDTIAVHAHVWPGHVVEMPIRLAGIDALELRGACPDERDRARRTKAALEAMLAAGHATLSDIAFDKYGGRAIAHVTAEGGNVGEALVGAGLVWWLKIHWTSPLHLVTPANAGVHAGVGAYSGMRTHGCPLSRA